MDKIEYKIIDNALDDEVFNMIRDKVTSVEFPWQFLDNITEKKMEGENFYFTHMFYQEHAIRSQFYQFLMPLFNIIKVKALIRIKGNLYTRTENPEIHPFHADYPFEHKGAIFYINTNNGLTILENGTEIKSVKNRLLLFDSSRPHKSTSCSDKKCRMNININYF
jgi:hypothetical protein